MTPLDALARSGARSILLAFGRYRKRFRAITALARGRFEQRDWQGAQRDATERLELYRVVVDQVVEELGRTLGPNLHDTGVWRNMKEAHAASIETRGDAELAETFYNSITRRIFATVGIDPSIEYVDLDIRRNRYVPGKRIHDRYVVPDEPDELRGLIEGVLDEHGLAAACRDAPGDAGRAARAIVEEWQRVSSGAPPERIDLIQPLFFRRKAAYIVGRMTGGPVRTPLVIVLVHGPEGVEVDAVLMREEDVSVVFSFTRSHFLVDVDSPSDIIQFLSSIMPRKRIAELYISLGHTKHGKTEIYRGLLGHLDRSMDPFVHAPGEVGMVMIVFTLHSHDLVFKVIRDEFAYPKTTSREDVLRKYQLVFKHDRAGRLIEAQEFEHLTFDARRFSPELLEELTTAAAKSVTRHEHEISIRHVYVERRVEPLDLFLRDAEGQAEEHAVLEYGQAIRDLAKTNIFPGDLLLKNFGVTRHGRVIFYDYDELCLVTDCRFRDLPTARDDGEEMASEAWFFVGDDDVFPEEFLHFMGLSERQRRIFLSAHAEVLTARFWRELQERHRAGEVLDLYPYGPGRRLPARAAPV